MGLLASMERRARTVAENPSPLTASTLIDVLGGAKSYSGIHVDSNTALSSAAVFACIRIISGAIARIPLLLYERLDPKGKERASGHGLYDRVRWQPNPEMTAFTFKRALAGNGLIWGDSYAEIERSKSGEAIGFWPLCSDRTYVERVKGVKVVVTRVSEEGGSTKYVGLPPERYLHIPFFSLNGLQGLSLLDLAKSTVGLAKAQERSAEQYFGSGARPAFLVKHPSVLNPDAQKRVKASLEMAMSGLTNHNRLAVLDEGMSAEKLSYSPEESQWIESRTFQVLEVARLWGVPPHMLAELTRATHTNIEQEGINFVTHTLGDWLEAWQQAYTVFLLSGSERKRYFFEFLTEHLVKTDLKTRYEAYGIAVDKWMTKNEIRDRENMNPLDGGDDLAPPEPPPAAPEPPPARALRVLPEPADLRDLRVAAEKEERATRSANARRTLQKAYQRLFEAAGDRLVRREVNALERLLGMIKREGLDAFVREVGKFYASLPEVARREMAPLLLSYAEALLSEVNAEVGVNLQLASIESFVGEYNSALAARHIGSSQGQIQALIEEHAADLDAMHDALGARFGEWRDGRPAKIGMRESVQAAGAIAVAAYAAAGITRIKWRSFGGCEICAQLNGRTVEVHGSFAQPGEVLQAGEGVPPLEVKQTMSHPPIHRGCDCAVSPE